VRIFGGEGKRPLEASPGKKRDCLHDALKSYQGMIRTLKHGKGGTTLLPYGVQRPGDALSKISSAKCEKKYLRRSKRKTSEGQNGCKRERENYLVMFPADILKGVKRADRCWLQDQLGGKEGLPLGNRLSWDRGKTNEAQNLSLSRKRRGSTRMDEKNDVG